MNRLICKFQSCPPRAIPSSEISMEDLSKIEVIKAAAVLGSGERVTLQDDVQLVLAILRNQEVWHEPAAPPIQISQTDLEPGKKKRR